jgi:hypothetical protein
MKESERGFLKRQALEWQGNFETLINCPVLLALALQYSTANGPEKALLKIALRRAIEHVQRPVKKAA